MTTQDLDFTGGPWKLRNGMVVKKLSRNDSGSHYTYTAEDYNIVWNFIGEAHREEELGNGNFCLCPEFDIMENLDNWKYNRKGE